MPGASTNASAVPRDMSATMRPMIPTMSSLRRRPPRAEERSLSISIGESGGPVTNPLLTQSSRFGQSRGNVPDPGAGSY